MVRKFVAALGGIAFLCFGSTVLFYWVSYGGAADAIGASALMLFVGFLLLRIGLASNPDE